MYIIIFEDGEIKMSKALNDEDFNNADNGLIDIINTKDLTQWVNSEWKDIEVL